MELLGFLLLALLFTHYSPTTAETKVFVFGDSLADVGNNNYLPGDDNAKASIAWPDLVHSEGLNFASGGSGILDSIGTEGSSITMAQQIQYFADLQSKLAERIGTSKTNIKDHLKGCCGAGRFNAEIGCNLNATYCTDRDRYLFWDMLHPTQVTARVASLAFYIGSLEFASPINFKQLVEDDSYESGLLLQPTKQYA